MRRGFKIGRFFGFNIRADWSWLVIFFLTAWSLGTSFGSWHPDWSPALQWTTAIVAALLFFASVLIHEVAHALVAKARGIPVRSITLFLFGGVANIEREPSSPGDEFLMAILGPVTSFVVGGVFILITLVSIGQLDGAMQNPTQVARALGPVATVALWLGSINMILGLFNLIPGFPLDGGRVLRSIFWAITDNLRRATRWATAIGQGIAWLFIISGIAMAFGANIPFFGTGVANGLWLSFIGWFLHNAAVQGYRQVLIDDVLEDVPVSRLMRTSAPIVSPDLNVARLIEDYIMRTDTHAFTVVEGGAVRGTVCLDDVRSVPAEERGMRTVREIMTPASDLVITDPDEEANDALKKLAQRDVCQLPVLRGEELVGVLRRQDIVRWLQLESDLNVG